MLAIFLMFIILTGKRLLRGGSNDRKWGRKLKGVTKEKKQPVLGYYTPTDNRYTAIWHM
jgi:hypothetical protein